MTQIAWTLSQLLCRLAKLLKPMVLVLYTVFMLAGREVTIPTNHSPCLEWFGNLYSWDDLRDALALLASPSTEPAHLIPSQHQDALHPATWRFLNQHAVALLEALSGLANAGQVRLLPSLHCAFTACPASCYLVLAHSVCSVFARSLQQLCYHWAGQAAAMIAVHCLLLTFSQSPCASGISTL